MYRFFGLKPTKKEAEWERKVSFGIYAAIAAIVAIILVYSSETEVKDCKKNCQKKGFDRSLYVPENKGRKSECKCYKMVETEEGTIMVGEDKKQPPKQKP